MTRLERLFGPDRFDDIPRVRPPARVWPLRLFVAALVLLCVAVFVLTLVLARAVLDRQVPARGSGVRSAAPAGVPPRPVRP